MGNNFFDFCDKAKELYSFYDINPMNENEVKIIIQGLQMIQEGLDKYMVLLEEEKKKEEQYRVIIR